MTTTTDGRSTRWEEHRAARRKELVEATLRAIRKHGAGVGMDEIAATAGTSKTVVYRHFTDRQGLYAAVSARVDALILRDITTAMGAVDRDLTTVKGSPRDLIAGAIDAYLRLVERDPEVYRFIVTAPLLDRAAGADPDTDPARPVTTHIADQMTAVIGQAFTETGHDCAAAPIWGTGLVGMVRAAADQWLLSPGTMSREQLTQHLTDLAWGGLSTAWHAGASPQTH